MRTRFLFVALSLFLAGIVPCALGSNQLHSDGFESGDKTGFDGTRTGTNAPDIDLVQSGVKASGTYAWHFDQHTNDFAFEVANSVYFTQSMPATNKIVLRAKVRIDNLTHEFGFDWALLYVYSSANGPWEPSAGLSIDVTNNYIGVYIEEADLDWYESFGTTAFDVNDGNFHELMLEIDNSGADPVLTAWYDGAVAHQNTFAGVILPTFQTADFGSWMLTWGDHDIDVYFDDCQMYDAPATPLYRSVGTNANNLNADSRSVTISGSTATFSGPMPNNLGVGDVLTYDSGGNQLAFIHGRTSSTVFTVKNKDGATPTAASAGTAVGVYRAYTSLFNWESQAENPNITEPTENDVNPSTGLVSAFTVMMVACYADGADTTNVVVDGWTTGASNYPSDPESVGTPVAMGFRKCPGDACDVQ